MDLVCFLLTWLQHCTKTRARLDCLPTGVVEGRRGRGIMEDEELKLERQLKIINKPANITIQESALAPVDPDWGVGVQPADPSLPPAREKKLEPTLSHWAVTVIVVIVIVCFFFLALLLVGACLLRRCLIARATRRVVSVDFEL